MHWRKVELSTKYVQNAIEVISKMLEPRTWRVGLGAMGTTGVLALFNRMLSFVQCYMRLIPEFLRL